MTPALRHQKQTLMRLRFQQACEAHHAGDYELAAFRASQISDISGAYVGVDSDLFWYGARLGIVWSDFFMQDDTRDFKAWAVGQACKALRAAA